MAEKKAKIYEVRKNEGVKFIAIPAFEALGLVHHGFSTRVGGVSTGPFKGMNLSLNAGEDKDLVEINRCMFVKAMNAGNPDVYTVRQMHGTRVLRIENRDHPTEEYRQAQADAIITDQPGLAIGVLTADCVPILMIDPEKRAVAAVHAGREGSLNHLISNVIERMRKDFGTLPGDLRAALGPCIEAGCYEVGDDIAQRIDNHNPDKKKILFTRDGSYFLDLRKMNHRELLDCGVKEDYVYHVDLCTACAPRTFYSYRKSNGKETGRMMAMIMLNEA
ncbi:MAG: peptidoglycan editing factor PgeF [bacterium]